MVVKPSVNETKGEEVLDRLLSFLVLWRTEEQSPVLSKGSPLCIHQQIHRVPPMEIIKYTHPAKLTVFFIDGFLPSMAGSSRFHRVPPMDLSIDP